MSIIEALILGSIQGITEFLPVSSSGHLVLVQKIFGISEPVLLFDTMVHLGTLAAVFVVLWRDIAAILRKIFQPLTGFLVLATIPTVIAALLFKDLIEESFNSGSNLGFAFLFTALALLVSDILSRRKQKTPPTSPEPSKQPSGFMGWVDALVIGICQAAAIIPGVSRSGLTLSGALSRKLDRDFAARFSFLISIPAILGALVFQVKDLAEGQGGSIGAGAMIAGAVAAAVVGFFSVKFMLRIVKKHALWGFAIYVAVLGAAVLTDQYLTHFFF
jgi:undecaprenyl-diphosphatase